MKPLEIVPDIFSVGVLNPDLKVFDIIMETEFGTSYNAYLVRGRDKIALIDGVKFPFAAEHREHIAAVADLAQVDYIIVQHTEPDHAGSIGELVERAPGAVVVGSRPALNNLTEQLNRPFPQHPVGEGDALDLGGLTLRFIMAPFLHWPDTLFTWVPERGLLFTCDMFGCHYCAPEVFDDTADHDLSAAQRYYFDGIMSPFADYALQAIAKIRPLPIDMIAPSHGPVLRTGHWSMVDRYTNWCQGFRPQNDPLRVVIAYVSAYGYTRMLAERAQRQLTAQGLAAELIEITSVAPGRMTELINGADGLLIGSPTFNRDALPPVWGLLTNLSYFRHKGRPMGAFGSYGWSGEAVAQIEGRLKGLGMAVPVPGYRVRFLPSDVQLQGMDEFTAQFAAAVLATKK